MNQEVDYVNHKMDYINQQSNYMNQSAVEANSYASLQGTDWSHSEYKQLNS